MPDWDAIRKEYVTGGISLNKLAEKYGVTLPNMKKHCAQGKWTELRNQKVSKKTKAMVTAVAAKEVKKMSVTQRCADMGLDALAKYIEEQSSQFDGTEFRNVAAALKTFKEVKHDLTELELREQDARIRALEKQSEDKTVTKDTEVKVTFVGLEELTDGT